MHRFLTVIKQRRKNELLAILDAQPCTLQQWEATNHIIIFGQMLYILNCSEVGTNQYLEAD
jgi:hypothetical protein